MSFGEQPKKLVHPRLNYKRTATNKSLLQKMLKMRQSTLMRKTCSRKTKEKAGTFSRSSKLGNRAQKKGYIQALGWACKAKVLVEWERDLLVKVAAEVVKPAIRTNSIYNCSHNINSCPKYQTSNPNS